MSIDHRLPRDVLAYCLGFLADHMELFRSLVALRLVSRRLREAVSEAFQQYTGPLVPPTIASARKKLKRHDPLFFAAQSLLYLGTDDSHATQSEIEGLLTHVLPQTPSITEIDFGASTFSSPPQWLSKLETLPTLAPQITKLDLLMVFGIKDFTFIVHYARTLTSLSLNDVGQMPMSVSPLSAVSQCDRLNTLVIRFSALSKPFHVQPQRRVDFGETSLNSTNRLSFLDGPLAASLEVLTIFGYHFSVNRAEDHSLAKAENLRALTLTSCGGIRHIFYVRKMRNLEFLSIGGAAIAHRRSERTLRMLAELPKLETLLMDDCFWAHHLSVLCDSLSLLLVTTGGSDCDEEDNPIQNASGKWLELRASAYPLCGEDCFPDSQNPVSDTDDEYL